MALTAHGSRVLFLMCDLVSRSSDEDSVFSDLLCSRFRGRVMIRILHMTVVDICRLSSRSLDIPIRYRPDFAALEVLKIAAMVSAEVFVDRMVTMVKPKYGAKFMRSGSIRTHMASLVKLFNEDMEHTIQTRKIDPVTIASPYWHYFVSVHPFVDSNGRMCRLILDTVLLKFTGICTSVGVEAKEREDWTMLS